MGDAAEMMARAQALAMATGNVRLLIDEALRSDSSEHAGQDEPRCGNRGTLSALSEWAPVEALSEREQDILALVAKGLSNREVAEALYISVNTTQWHLSHIYQKLGVKSRTQAIVRAKEARLLQD